MASMILYRVFLSATTSKDDVLTDETKEDTGAVAMTLAEAEAAGVSGIPGPPDGVEMAIVIVGSEHEARVNRGLEQSPAVAKFDLHYFEM